MLGTDTPEGQWELSTFSAVADDVARPTEGERPSEARARLQRRLVLQSALRITSVSGYDSLSTALIIRASGVSRRSFNAWFATAEDAFVAAHDHCMEQMVRAVRTAIDDEARPEHQLRQGLEAVVEYVVADPARADAVLLEVHAAGHRAVRSHEAAVDALIREAHGVLVRGGVDEAIVGRLARFGVGAVREAIRTRAVRGELHTLPTVVDELASAAFPLRSLVAGRSRLVAGASPTIS